MRVSELLTKENIMSVPYTSNFDLTMPFVDDSAVIALGAAAEETYTVPGTSVNKYSVRFSYTSTSNVFVRKNDTPTIPAGGTVEEEENTEFRPGGDGTQRYVQGGDVLHFITPDASAYVGIRLMKLPQ